MDLAAYKTTRLAGRLNFELRFEFYNLFNYDNLYLSNDLSSGNFGKAISQQLPFWWQIGVPRPPSDPHRVLRSAISACSRHLPIQSVDVGVATVTRDEWRVVRRQTLENAAARVR